MPKLNNAKNFVKKVTDPSVDTLDKVLGQTSRTGSSIERIAKMRKAGVSKQVTALQMTENSSNNTKYTIQDVETCEKIFADCKTKVVVTKAQTTALIKDQKKTAKNNGINKELQPA